MVRRVRIEEYFRKRLRLERDEVRGWSQAELAKMLTARGIDMHPTTIAKIEAGDRAAPGPG